MTKIFAYSTPVAGDVLVSIGKPLADKVPVLGVREADRTTTGAIDALVDDLKEHGIGLVLLHGGPFAGDRFDVADFELIEERDVEIDGADEFLSEESEASE